jgi:hypothetical protein
MTPDLETIVREEIEALHRFFIEWFSGAAPESDLEEGILNRLAPDLVFVPPGGSLLGRDALETGLRQGYGTNPDFRIAIRNVTVHRVLESHVVATYEEWQRNALASKPPDNARLATVLFENSRPLRWLHIHETWMPEDVAAAGPYDF